jgi:two-component system, chemotaxis family, protein-glutamate methylesterase/glutaminase
MVLAREQKRDLDTDLLRKCRAMPESVGTQTRFRDIVVIGASAGGLQALQELLPALPSDLRASIFIVLHVGATSHLSEILDRMTALPVVQARSGDEIEAGRIYVAVPGVHLLLHDDHILLRRGPRENLARPAVDPLFRSAGCTFGARVIGVVLSGGLNDGTAGLRAIKRCGGIAVVQDPRDAAFPDMPLSALQNVEIDHVAPARALGGLLIRLTREIAGETPLIPLEIRLETAIAAQELSGMDTENQLGKLSRFTCPECHGMLWEIEEGSLLRYRCHVGHAFTAAAMLHAHTASAEEMLWSLMRVHQERAALARRMAEEERARFRHAAAEELQQRARGYDEDAEIVRGLLRDHMATIETSDPGQDAS